MVSIFFNSSSSCTTMMNTYKEGDREKEMERGKKKKKKKSFHKLLLQVAMAMNWRTWALMMMVMIDEAIGVVNVVIVMNWGIVVGNNNGDEFKSSYQKWWWWWSFSKFFLNPSWTPSWEYCCFSPFFMITLCVLKKFEFCFFYLLWITNISKWNRISKQKSDQKMVI